MFTLDNISNIAELKSFGFPPGTYEVRENNNNLKTILPDIKKRISLKMMLQ